MQTPDSRDIIHNLLANDQTDDLLRAALHHSGDAAQDGDVLRALMQAALAEGDMETVRNTAIQLVDTGIALGNVILALEGICLSRNVEGDAEAATEQLLDAIDARGFSTEDTCEYPEWTLDIEGAREAYADLPPSATILAIFNENVLPDSTEAFGWVSLWPHLTRESRKVLIELLHFEMGMADTPVLSPPRLEVAWAISGEFAIEDRLFRSVPGSLIMRSTDEALLQSGRHMRLVGLNAEQWKDFRTRDDVKRALEQKKIRARAVHTLIVRSRDRSVLDEEQMHELLRSGRMMHLGGGTSARDHARVALLLDGRGSFSIHADDAVVTQELRLGTLLHIPSGLALDEADITLLYWRIEQFEDVAPLDAYEVTRLAAPEEDPASDDTNSTQQKSL